MIKLDVQLFKGKTYYKKIISIKKTSVPYFIKAIKGYRLKIVSITVVKETLH